LPGTTHRRFVQCCTCQHEGSLDIAPEAEKVYVGEYWRVAVVRRSALPSCVPESGVRRARVGEAVTGVASTT
jgi:hypothetical protein